MALPNLPQSKEPHYPKIEESGGVRLASVSFGTTSALPQRSKVFQRHLTPTREKYGDTGSYDPLKAVSVSPKMKEGLGVKQPKAG